MGEAGARVWREAGRPGGPRAGLSMQGAGGWGPWAEGRGGPREELPGRGGGGGGPWEVLLCNTTRWVMPEGAGWP